MLVIQNRLLDTSLGLRFTGSTGLYQGNLTSGCATPYSGGTDAGNNQ